MNILPVADSTLQHQMRVEVMRCAQIVKLAVL